MGGKPGRWANINDAIEDGDSDVIVEDTGSGTVTINIDGSPVGVFDSSGLTVTGDISSDTKPTILYYLDGTYSARVTSVVGGANITGDLDVSRWGAFGSTASVNNGQAATRGVALTVKETFGSSVNNGTWGLNLSVRSEADAAGAYVYGANITAANYAAADQSHVTGANISAISSYDTGMTITDVKGLNVLANLGGDNSIATRLIGIDVTTSTGFSMAATSATDIMGIRVQAMASGSGAFGMPSVYGIQILAPGFTSTGTKTDLYGLYVADQSQVGFTNDYNIFSAGANSLNVFEGEIDTPNLRITGGDTTTGATISFTADDLIMDITDPDGSFYLTGVDGDSAAKTMITAHPGDGVELSFNGSKVFETSVDSIILTPPITNEFAIINSATGGNILLKAYPEEGAIRTMAVMSAEGSFDLYHAGVKKFASATDGADVFGVISGDTAPTDADHLTRKDYVDDIHVTLLTNGWEDDSNVALSYDDSTPPILTLTFTGTVYYWSDGVKYSKSGTDTLQISDVNGSHWFYYDGETLTQATNPSHAALDAVIKNKCLVAMFSWNTNTNELPIAARETHGIIMSGATHEWLHDNIGAKMRTGGGISGYTLDTASDAAISFDLTDIEFYDEDLEHEVVDGSASVQYEQVLTGDAEIPVLYRDDVTGDWIEQAASTLPYLVNTRLQYMNDDGDGTWSRAEIGQNAYCNYWLVLTNDWNLPVKMIPGTQEYSTPALAQANAGSEITEFGDLPAAEYIILYRFLMRDSSGGTKDAKIIDITDYRFSGITGASAQTANDHGALSGLNDDDHAQYALVDGTRAFTGTVSIGDGAAVDATIGITADDLYITNNDPDGLVYITAEKSATGQSTLVSGDPDGAASLYYAGNAEFETMSDGVKVDTYLQISRSGGDYNIYNTYDGGIINLKADNSSAAEKTLFSGNPDGAASLYHAGVATARTYVLSGVSQGFEFGDFTTSDATDATIKCWVAGGTAYFKQMYHNGSLVFQGEDASGNTEHTLVLKNAGSTLYNASVGVMVLRSGGTWWKDGTSECATYVQSGAFIFDGGTNELYFLMRSKDNAGATKNIFQGDPDGSVDLYHLGVNVVSTTTEGISVIGGGVKFPATQVPSSDANTLDDYEEGTWTPVVYDADTDGNAGSSTTPLGTYTKIGRQVTLHCHLTDITTAGLTAGNQLHIGGVPFARQTDVAVTYYAAVMVGNVTFTDSVVASFIDTKERIVLTDLATGAAQTSVKVSDLTSGSADIRFSLVYEV